MESNRTSAFFRLCRRLAVALLAATVSWSARGQVTIDQVIPDPIASPPANGVAYNVGEEIFIVAVFSSPITGVTGVPKLRLTSKRTGQNETYAFATYYDHWQEAMFFRYVVESGDFTQDLNADRFERAGTVIQTSAGLVGYDTQMSFPATGAASLAANADIAIRTIGLRGQIDPLSMTITVQETESALIPVTRGNTGGKAVGFTMTATPPAAIGQNFTLAPATFAIPIGMIDGDLTLTGVLALPGTVLRLHPTDYGAETAGDLLVTVNVTSGPAPTFFVDGLPYGLIEGDPNVATATITLSRPHTAPLTVTLANNNPDALAIVGSTSITFPIGETSRSYQVRALDGGTTVANDSTATVSGTVPPASGYISAGSAVFSLLNRDPVLLSPQGTADNPWVPTPGGEGFPYTFGWSGTDVAADIGKLQAQIAFGDGNVTAWMDGANGFVNHTYNSPGNYTVTVTLRDQDGGYASVSGQIEILPAVQVQINEYKYSSPPYIGPGNPYNGLGGLGRGTIDDLDPLTTRIVLQNDFNWLIKYGPTQPSVTLVATPETVTVDGVDLDSFFHVWIGDGFFGNVLTPIAPSTALLQLGGEDRQIGGVFSREYYPDDNYADIDHDELPDQWEWQWGIDFELPNRMDNPDGDLLPRGAGAAFAYPAAENNYTPDGGAFGHVFEVRGLDPGLNAPNSTPSAIVDEPGAPLTTAGWPGSDPTVPDTDGDSLNDGYEYYFWMNATVRGVTGQRYDPTRVIEGTVIDSATIAADFNPLVQGADDDDTDGDGLSNREEYALGTNPIHWDTDGDGMNDAWEVAYGLNPFDDGDANGNPDGDWMARSGAQRHWQVYQADGYDPRVAWGRNYLWRNRSMSRRTPTTEGFSNYEEHYLGRLCIEEGIVGAVAPVGSGLMTSPIAADSDADQMPDGWELYVSRDPVAGTVVIWPISSDNYIQNSALDADYDGETDADELTVRQEFHASETCAVYGFANVNDRWWNKFWATDPWNPDTDGDAIVDGGENWAGFRYDSGYTEYIRGSRPGGMLNPCCVDTDMDYIPDAFEYLFPGEIAGGEIADGMDGTYFDSKSGPDAITGDARNFDFDRDGLENYQEYWMNAVFHFQYDKWVAGQGYGAYDPALIFTQFPYGWDWAANADYDELIFVPFAFMPVEFRPASPYGPVCYASTDPREFDTDEDGMDDHYEMFHGLNPLLSQTQDLVGKTLSRPPDVYDFRTNPWLAGMQNADPDQDGIPNYEEMLMPNRPEPANHHTDPSPLWFTDTSYANSFVNLYYNLGAVPMYWVTNSITSDPFPEPSYMENLRPFFMYSFEIGEGYDTDNDNLQDKQETISSTEPGLTDPLDTDAPRLRKALYLNGINAAARTRVGFAYGPDALRSWTIEAWVRPANPAAGVRQVILERPVQVFENDPMPAPDYVRRTFRLGLEWNGAPFVEYDDAGKVALTERATAADWPLTSTNWTHLAATMNGVDKRLTLYVNGKVAAATPTASIPCTGFIDGSTYLYSGAPVVIGASDANPQGAVNGGFTYINGDVFGGPSQPVLGDFFKGWVDEIRIWDGARPASAIAADLAARRRYTRADVIASREAAVAELQQMLSLRGYALPPAGYSFDGYYVDAAFWLMRTGGETPAFRLPPTLLSHYSFDNLPDPQHELIVPAGFDHLNGRPTADYPGVPWWMQAADRSTVYRTFDASPYLFVHWIENTVATLPLGHLDVNGTFVADAALDSRYWTRFSTGGAALSNGLENVFNNTSNPYGLTYKHGDSTMNQVDTEDFAPRFDPMSDAQYNHLLPLRGAVADMDVPLWDNGTPGTTPDDRDGDGMLDWWELVYGLDPDDPADADFDADGDGISNYWESRLGLDPFRVNSLDSEVPDSAMDFDGDGVSNAEELNLYGSDPTNSDTDNDGLPDKMELDMGLLPTDSLSPLVLRYVHNDGTGLITVPGSIPVADPQGLRLSLDEWTIEATVRLTGAPAEDIVLIRRLTEPSGYVNYELGITTERIPYVRFQSIAGAEYRVDGYGPLPTNEWVYLGGRFGEDERGSEVRQLALFLNSERIVRDTTSIHPVTGPMRGDMSLGENLVGDLDEVRIWNYSRADQEIADAHGKTLLFGADVARMASLEAGGGTGSFVANYRPSMALSQWTVEAWFKTDNPGVILQRPTGVADDGQPIYNYRMNVAADGRLQASFDILAQLVFFDQTLGFWVARDRWGTVTISSGKTVVDDDWHHVAFVVDTDLMAVSLYLDGSLENVIGLWPNINTVAWHLAGGDDDSYRGRGYQFRRVASDAGPLAIGPGFPGLIDEVRIYNAPFPQIDIQRRKDIKAPIIPSLVSYFDFDAVDPRTPTIVFDRASPADSGELRLGAALAMEPGDNAPIQFNSLDILRSSLAAYFPFEDGRNVADGGVQCVEDFVYALSISYQNKIFAGTLSPTPASIDFVSYWGFAIGDYSDPMNYPENLSPADPDSPFRSFPLPPDSPWRMDSDFDSMPDIYEQYYRMDANRAVPPERKIVGPFGDMDGDGLSNLYEYYAGTDPTVWDSVESGVADADFDSDGDGISNGDEEALGTHPGRVDTDDDGFTDYDEVYQLTGAPEYLAWSNAADSMDPKDPFNLLQADPRLRFKSMVLDGLGHEISRPLTDRHRFNTPEWTIEAWVRVANANATGSLIQYVGEAWTNGVSTPLTFYELGLADGRPYVKFQASALYQTLDVERAPLPLNQWVHLAGVWDPANNSLALYQDGIQISALQVFDTALSGSLTAHKFPGHAYVGGAGVLGTIDDVRIWSVARRADQIADGTQHLVQLYEPGQIANFRFDDGGEHAEDFAHRLTPSDLDVMRLYALRGITFADDHAVLATITDFDDADGDGLPDYWENLHFNSLMTYYLPVEQSDGRISGITPATIRLTGGMDASYSAYNLGWTVDFTPIRSIPGHRWSNYPDAAWLFRDFNLADASQPVEIRMASAPLPDIRLFLNGVEIDLASTNVVTPAALDIRVPTYALIQTFYLPPELLQTNLVAGRNRIAIEMINRSDWIASTDISDEYFNLELYANGQTYLIRRGDDPAIGEASEARWWAYSHDGSMVEPPLDGQGLPWFDRNYAFDQDGDPDGDTLPNWFEFTAGCNPQSVDTDSDGVPDSQEDADGDGVQNYTEFMQGTEARLADTDDDGFSDGWEIAYGSSPVDSRSPAKARALALDGTAASQVVAPEVTRLELSAFDISAWVYPTAAPTAAGEVVAREVAAGVYNYRLYLDSQCRPVAQFTDGDGVTQVVLAAPDFRAVPLNAWTHLRMTFDATTGHLALLVNDEAVAFLNTARRPLLRSNGATATRVGSGLSGFIDEVEIRSGAECVLRYTFDDDTADLGTAVRGAYGTTGAGAWHFGQVEDFADVFTAVAIDWQSRLREAGSLAGGAAIVALVDDEGDLLPGDWVDTDGDGLPDAWETLHNLNPLDADTDGDGIADGLDDDDLDGLNNLNEFLAGTDPNDPQTTPGIFDWEVDSDGDGLSNWDEQCFGSDPGLLDTDDDGLSDFEEASDDADGFTLPNASLSPARAGALQIDGDGQYAELPLKSRFRLEKSWTVEAWVRIDPAFGGTGTIIRRGGGSLVNYELGFDANRPFVRLASTYETSPFDRVVMGDAALARRNHWYHLAGVYDADQGELRLFVDGVLVNWRQVVAEPGAFSDSGLLPVRIGEGFLGLIDEVRVWDEARDAVSLADGAYRTFEHASAMPVAYLRFDDFGTTAEDFARPREDWRRGWESAAALVGGAAMAPAPDSPVASTAFVDEDADELPDFWELAVFGNIFGGIGMADMDGDGLNNTYEYLARLHPRLASTFNDGVMDGHRDFDGDGLLNILEQDYTTRPDMTDTDDDGFSDYEEIYGTTPGNEALGVSSPLQSLDPHVPRGLELDGTGRMVVPPQGRHSLVEWTLAAWVSPATGSDGGIVVARTFSDGAVNYELGVEPVGGALRPYTRYTSFADGILHEHRVSLTTLPGTVLADGVENHHLRLEPGTWAHLAAVYSITNHTLSLYLDGERVAWRTDAIERPATGSGAALPLAGELTVGGGPLDAAGTAVTGGFEGRIDDVRISALVSSDADIRQMMGGQLVVESGSPITNTVHLAASAMPAPKAGEYLVGLKAGVPADATVAALQGLGVQVVRRYGIVPALHVRVADGADAEAVRAQLAQHAGVSYVEPNYNRTFSQTVPDDPDFGELWGLHNTGQGGGTEDADIDAPEAWDVSTGDRQILVAVIDTGIDYNHPDLAANMWVNPGEIPGNGLDDDGNGYIDDIHGYDFANDDSDPMDTYGHGTHCAGTIGAVGNNGTSVAGINWNVRLMAVRAGDEFGLYDADIVASIDYAVQMGARISNNSYGGYGFSQTIYDAIARARDADHLFVAAAGNDANDNDTTPAYPASYDLDNIIAVAASDRNDRLASFSNYGAESVDLAAPGVAILSTVPGGGTAVYDGTSMATPHVVGAAALVLSVDNNLSYTALRSALLGNVDPVEVLNGRCLTGGRLNVGNILPKMGGTTAIAVRSLAAWFRFDDGGATVEDFTLAAPWRRDWRQAGRLEAGAAMANAAAFLPPGDTDGDTLPDWWEELAGLDPRDATGDNGADADPDGDGLVNLYEYLASRAHFARGERGLDPFLADTDNDGLTDAQEDSDGDAVANLHEQNLYATDPGDPDTDDDSLTDGEELTLHSAPTDATIPYVARALNFTGGDARANIVTVPDKVDTAYTARHSAREWTVECWVNPGAMPAGAYPLLSRSTVASGRRNYEIGLAGGVPYAAFDGSENGAEVVCAHSAAIPSGQWTHLAARFQLGGTFDQNHLSLFVNGVLVASVRTGWESATGPGDLVFGSAGLVGQLLNVRVWSIPQTDAQIASLMYNELLGGDVGEMSGYLSLTGTGHLKETATTTRPGGEYIDILRQNWTLECWVRTTATGGRLIQRRNESMRTDDDFNYYLGLTPAGTLIGRFAMDYTYMVVVPGNPPVTALVYARDYTLNNIVGEIPVNDGQWHHVAYVRSNSGCALYVDGLLDVSQDRTVYPPGIPVDSYYIAPAVYAAPGPCVFGEDLAGSMDEIRIWNRDLPTAELQAMAGINLAGDERGLVSYFNFDFQLGATADDRAYVRDPASEYGIYIPNATRLAGTGDGPPIAYDPLRAVQGVALTGLFLCNDGGEFVEDRVWRIGLSPFDNEKYAGRMGAAVNWAMQAPVLWAGGQDSDGDGLPDAWERGQGLDPFNPDSDGDGISDRFADLDGDGLPNYAEWLAGTDPWHPDSDSDGIGDYEDTSAGSARMNGIRFTDNDYTEDHWEAQYTDWFASPYRYDEHQDLDNDGWNNWSEARAGFPNLYRPDAEQGDIGSNGVSVASYPTPALRVTLDYPGFRELRTATPTLVVHAYTDPYMNGMPDAVFTRPFAVPDTWRMTLELTAADLVLGHLRQGSNYFYAFLDLDNSRNPAFDASINWLTWTPGEPAALADGHDKGIDIGWDRNEIRFGLTDEAKSFARLSWEKISGVDLDKSHVIAIYHAVSAQLVKTLTVDPPRTWLHEGDIVAGKSSAFGLGWGVASGLSVYRWTLDGRDKGYVTNIYSATLSAPVAVDPKNDVIAARPVFQFRLAPEATEFDIELRRVTTGGTVVYSGRHLAPPRQTLDMPDGQPSVNDACVWQFPYHAGDVMTNGQIFANDTYYWRVKGFSPAATTGSAWSDQPSFRLNVNAVVGSSGGKGWLTVNVRYPGAAGLGGGAPIRVQAFRTRSFNGIADAERQIAAPGAVTLAGLDPAGLYYIRAYLDQNNNRRRDFWESYGYLRAATDPVEPFRVVGVQTSNLGLTPAATVTIRDADTDNDLIPDAQEYVMHGAGGGDWLAKAGPGPIISSPGYSDYDGDGLNDLSENDAGTDWSKTDSDGDGIPDLLDRDLFGIEASIQKEQQVLQLTGLDPAAGLLGWRWTDRDALLDGLVPLGQPAQTEVVPLGHSASYVIEFTESLTAPAWQPVTNLPSGFSGGQFTLPRTTSPSGFYRIKMLTE